MSAPANDQGLSVHLNAAGAVMGGAARHLPPFVAALKRERPAWDLHVWVTEGAGMAALPDGVKTNAIPHYDIARRMWWESIELPRALRRLRADALVNLTNSAPLLPGVVSVLYQRNPLFFDPSWVASQPTRFRGEAFARRQLAFLQARSSDGVIVPSGAMAEYVSGWRGWPASAELSVVPHAVAIDDFPFAQRMWPPPTDRPLRLLSVSHASPHKGQELLFDLVAELLGTGQPAELWVTFSLDDAPEFVGSLQARARSLGVEGSIRFLGRTTDVARLYRDADLMVFPSLSESFGFPVLEAMACGIPVVASQIGPTEELLGDDGTYFVRGDVAGAASAVRAVLACPADTMHARLARSAEAAADHSWRANARQVARLLERRIERARNPRVSGRT